MVATKILEEGWMKKNIVPIFMNGITILILIVTIAVFITRTDSKATENQIDIVELKKVDCELDKRLDAEELFRVEAMTRLEYISLQLEALRLEIKEARE